MIMTESWCAVEGGVGSMAGVESSVKAAKEEEAGERESGLPSGNGESEERGEKWLMHSLWYSMTFSEHAPNTCMDTLLYIVY